MNITMPIAVLGLMATLGGSGAIVVGKPVPPAVPVAAQPNPDPKMPQFLDCATACSDCARVCDTCEAHCANLLAEGRKEHLSTLRTCQDCAAICSAAARVVAKNGPFTDLICTACADACKRCGDACRKHAEHDTIMKKCAEECDHCEKACRDMLKGVVKKGQTPKS